MWPTLVLSANNVTRVKNQVSNREGQIRHVHIKRKKGKNNRAEDNMYLGHDLAEEATCSIEKSIKIETKIVSNFTALFGSLNENVSKDYFLKCLAE